MNRSSNWIDKNRRLIAIAGFLALIALATISLPFQVKDSQLVRAAGCLLGSAANLIVPNAYASFFKPGYDNNGLPSPSIYGLFLPACGESDTGDISDLESDLDSDSPPPPPGSTAISKTCSGTYSRGQNVRMSIDVNYAASTDFAIIRVVDNLNANLDFVRMISGPSPTGSGAGGGDSLTWTFVGRVVDQVLEFEVVILSTAPTGTISNTAILNTPTGVFASSPCSITVTGPASITGDIYASRLVQNLTVSGPAVVSSGTGTPSITSVGENIYVVSQYTPRLTTTWRNTINTNLDRLRRERARFSAALPSDFDGTPDRLGGGVWYRTLGMTIPGASVSGRGTFIVDSGDITITGDIFAQRPIGIVARGGNIRIAGTVNQIRNVYLYAPNGTIFFEDSAATLSATGSFIAQRFSFSPRDLSITYDTRVALNPPPGFVSFLLPTILERAP